MLRRLLLTGLISISFVPSSFAASIGSLDATVQQVSADSSFPRGATRVPFLDVTLKASCDAAVTVSSMVIRHTGLGEASDLLRVYALKNNIRVSRSAVFSGSPSVATLRFQRVRIPACSSATFVIAADIASDAAAGGQHVLTIDGSQGIAAGVPVTIAAKPPTSRATTAPADTGSVELRYLDLPSDVSFGSNQILLRFSLKAQDHDQSLSSMTFTNDGSARGSDLQNMFISGSDGKSLTDVRKTMADDRVTLTFRPSVIIEQNATRVFLLHGDVRARRRRTIRLSVEEPSDITVTRASRR